MNTRTLETDQIDGDLYRAFWRWHFYAGVLILPMLMLMALTGGIYLFRSEIEAAIYRPMMVVEARPSATQPSAWVAAAERAAGGRVTQLIVPADEGRAVRLIVQVGEARRTVFVDPADARVTGVLADAGVMQFVKRLHSLELVGRWGNILVEIVAGWTIVMVVTGLYLWWPRGQAGGVISIRGAPARRVFWRDLHAVTGLGASTVVLFLALTGMPWSAVWGDQLRKAVNAAGLGAPRPPAVAEWRQDGHESHKPDVAESWALEGHALHVSQGAPPMINVDDIVLTARRADLAAPFSVSIPSESSKAWTAAHLAKAVESGRTLYFHPVSGEIIGDLGFAAFGPAARGIQWGIAVHQGDQFGQTNRYVMLFGCMAVWVMGVSALVMWWKRRPSNQLGAPPRPGNARAYLVLAVAVGIPALVFPLVGASLLLVLSLDLVFRKTVARLRSIPSR